MGTLKVDNIESRTGSAFTIGASGDTITIQSGATLETPGLTLSDNILFDTASKGIYLGVTSATASNLLDDYEEGTWTPTADSGVSGYTTESAKYTKIGNQVTVTCYLSSPTGKTGSSFIIGGLPFTTSANLFQPAVCDLQSKMRWIRSNESNDNLSFYNDDRTAVVGTDVGAHIILNITYQIA